MSVPLLLPFSFTRWNDSGRTTSYKYYDERRTPSTFLSCFSPPSENSCVIVEFGGSTNSRRTIRWWFPLKIEIYSSVKILTRNSDWLNCVGCLNFPRSHRILEYRKWIRKKPLLREVLKSLWYMLPLGMSRASGKVKGELVWSFFFIGSSFFRINSFSPHAWHLQIQTNLLCCRLSAVWLDNYYLIIFQLRLKRFNKER